MAEGEEPNPIREGDGTRLPGAKNGSPEAAQHRYDVGPGFEIAVRAEGKHDVALSVSKDADADHRHGAVNRRLESLERSVADLAARLAKVEAAVRTAEKTA